MIIAKKSCARSGDIQVEDGCLHRYARSDGRAVALMHRRKHHIAEGLFVGAGLPATRAHQLRRPLRAIARRRAPTKSAQRSRSS